MSAELIRAGDGDNEFRNSICVWNKAKYPPQREEFSTVFIYKR
jgi:hypothetical protein